MGSGLACRLCTVVAARTISAYATVIKVRRSPAIGSMATITLRGGLYMVP